MSSITSGGKYATLKKGYITIGGKHVQIQKAYVVKNGKWQVGYSGALAFKYYKPDGSEYAPGDKAYSFEGDPEGDWILRLWKSGILKFLSLPGDIEVWMNGAGGGSNQNNATAGGGGYIINQTLKNMQEEVNYEIHIGEGVMQSDGEATTAFGLTANGGKSAANGGSGASGGGGFGGWEGGASSGRGGSDGSNGAGTGSGTGQGVSTKEFGVGEPLSAGGGGSYTVNEFQYDGSLWHPYRSCPGGKKGGGAGGSGGNNDWGKIGNYGSNGAANTGSGGGANMTKGGSGRVSIRNAR